MVDDATSNQPPAPDDKSPPPPGEAAQSPAGDAGEPGSEPAHWATRLREFVDEATRVAREDLADKEVTFEDTKAKAEELIRKQPLTAVGIAAGVGLLAGILVHRRR